MPDLDAQQSQVVAHAAGPLLVVGGPGTGKTATLVEAVAARVSEGADPAHILVLTFGRKAAAALRNRIEARIGVITDRSTMSEPVVRTFPAYAFGLLRMAAAERGEPAPRLLTGPEQDAVIRDLLADPEAAGRWPESLRKAVRTRAFAAELRDLLLRAAERGIGAGALAAMGRENKRPDWVAAAHFLAEYVQVLALRDASTRGSVAYDQAELVRAAAALLADNPDLLEAERDRCQYVYVDELSDTDPAQLDLLGLIVTGGRHVVGFADPDSSTFAFRGADPTAVYDFADRFPTGTGDSAPVITLSTGYRAAPELMAATGRVAARLRGPAGHRQITPAPAETAGQPEKADPAPGERVTGEPVPGGPVPGEPVPGEPRLPALEVCTLRSLTSECAYVAHRLREAHLYHGIPWSRMAVIVRSLQHHHSALRRALTQAGVPVATGAEDTALATQPAVAPFLLLLRCALAQSRLDEEAAVTLLHSALGGADPFVERKLRQSLREIAVKVGDRRPSGELLVEALEEPAQLALIEERWARPALAVAHLIATAQQAAARPGATAEDVLWAVWRASGLADRWAALSARGGRRGATADRDLDAILVLFDAAARFTDRLPGARIEAFLDHLLDQQLPADTLAPSADRGDAVRLATAHAAKGLEWDVVAIVGVQEGVWPDLRLRGSVLGSERLVDVAAGREVAVTGQVSALLDEERRLFYVATTRARRSLLVTAVDPSSTGSGGEEQPSRFLAELAGGDPQQHHPVEGGASGEPAEVPPGSLRRPLTLAALVAELRAAVTDGARPDPVRAAAAKHLATLAAAGVPGADPDEWWGLRELSDTRPLARRGEVVKVTAAHIDMVLKCGLRWLLERNGGSVPSAKQGIGDLFHAAAMALENTSDGDVVRRLVAERFDQIELPARWLAERERTRALKMVDKILTWAAENPRELLAIEAAFECALEPLDRGPDVVLKGSVDRLERDEHGRLVVVDLKTGASPPSERATAEHPQLAAYQVAIESGAFRHGSTSGGAYIVAVGSRSEKAVVREQLPLAESDDPAWGVARVREAAEAMAAATFMAEVNEYCRYCAVRTSCPISSQGRQVTET